MTGLYVILVVIVINCGMITVLAVDTALDNKHKEEERERYRNDKS